MRRVYFFRWGKKNIGQNLVLTVPIYCILIIIFPIALRLDPFVYVNPAHWELPKTVFPSWSVKREEIISKLNKEPGKHLIIVKYWPDHTVEAEWVYNEANIDKAKVVWARNMSLEENCQLINYFSDRKVWILEKKNSPEILLNPYPTNLCTEQPIPLKQ